MKTLQLTALAAFSCLLLTTASFGQRAAESGTITLKDNKGHEVTLIPQRTAPEGSWVFEIPYDSPYLHTGDQKPQANPLGDEPYITFGAGDNNLSNNRILAVSSGLSLTLGGTDNSNATLANTGVLSLAGTSNQVSVSASTGAITLSLPQNIHSGATPAFVNASLTGMSAGSTFTNIVVSNGGALETRTIASLGKTDGSEPLLTFNAGGSSMTNNRVLSPGFGIALTDAGSDNGAFTIENSGVLSVAGTANQVSVSGSTGNVTFSLPQNIHTGASPTFQGLSIGGFTGTSIATDLVVSLGGVLETRSIASLGKSDGSEPYLTFAPGGSSMTNNRVLTAGTGIILTDAGSDNGAMTVSLPGIPWTLNGNNFNPGDFIGGEAGNTNPLDLRTNNTTRLLLNEDASIQRDAGGDARGLYSTDMQATRSSNDQVASGFFATISGGADNRASGMLGAVVGGGANNVASGMSYSTVGGGSGNISSAVSYSTIAGGNNNTASGNYSTIGGGRANVASGHGATIGGGGHDGSSPRANIASGIGTTIGGGAGNDATVDFSTVGGGVDNIAANYAATVGGGDGNQAYNYGTVVGGGAGNQVYEFLGTVSGGGGNAAVEEMGTISGGLSNIAWGVATTISGGVSNTANADSSTIGGGSFNTTSGLNSTVNGGSSNRALSQYSTVGGGYFNLASGGTRATVGGGGSNTANAAYATVSGGLSNTASHNSSTVGGGQSNSAANDGSTVSGGLTNMADGLQSAIGGGANNRTSGGSSAVGGGTFNTASGAFSAIPGGTQNTASGERSIAMGYYANASNYGQVSHASGRFAANGDAQGSLYTLRNTTSGATSSDLYLDGTSLPLPIANNSAVTFSILVVGKSSAGETAGYELKGIIERVGGTTAIIGAVVKTVLGEDDAAWDVAATAGASSLTITATGNTSDDVRWVATVRTSEVTY